MALPLGETVGAIHDPVAGTSDGSEASALRQESDSGVMDPGHWERAYGLKLFDRAYDLTGYSLEVSDAGGTDIRDFVPESECVMFVVDLIDGSDVVVSML